MEKVLVSACMVGRPVRYDGRAKTVDHPVLAEWRDAGRLVSCCPELEGALAVPRPPAEIEGGAGGAAVLAGRARILTATGADVTPEYLAGANAALALARSMGIRIALLKEGSPSCGTLRIHDGGFQGRVTPGAGVTSALLEAGGVRVFSEDRIAEAAAYLHELEATGGTG